MCNLSHFQCLNQVVNRLDSRGFSLESPEMVEAYMKRNMLGIKPETRIHRIFQSDFLEADILHNRITLPAASAGSWKDPLENPLANLITHKPPQPSTPALGRVCNSRPHLQFDLSSLSSQNAC